MKILLLGWYYSSNLGDAVICDCVAAQLRAGFPGADVVVRDLCGRTEFPARTSVPMDELLRQRRRHKLRVAATKLGWDKQLSHERWCIARDSRRMQGITDGDWDLAVFAGGQIFMDDLILYAQYAVRGLERRGIPVIFNACGTGPSCSRALRRCLAETLKYPNVKAVTCRDDVAAVNRWCGAEVAAPTDDPALWADVVYQTARDPNADTVGLGVMFPRSLDSNRVAAFWRGVMRALDDAGIPWKIFTNGSEGDMTFARTLLDGRDERLCSAPGTPEALVARIASFRSLISFRLHSHILAAALGVPSVAVAWDRKVPGFFEKIGYPERCLIIKEAPERVLSCLADAEKKGIDRSRIEKRREDATALLCSQILR